MKSIKCFLLTLCLVCGLIVSAHEKRINTPYWVYSPTSDFVIKGITLSEKSTTLNVIIREYGGGWWSLDSAAHLIANGRNHKILSAKRYVIKDGKTGPVDFLFNKRFTTENNETDSLVIDFEPIQKNTQAFDFIENEQSNWMVLGIRTIGKPYPSLIKSSGKTSVEKELQPFVPKYEKAVLKGHIYGYFPKMGVSTHDRNYFTNREEPFFNISSSGDFNIEAQITFPTVYRLYIGNTELQYMLVPGETVSLDIDVAALTAKSIEESNNLYKKHDFRQAYIFSGTTAPCCNIINKANVIKGEKFDTTMTFSQFTDDLWNVYQNKVKEIDPDKNHTKQECMLAKLQLQLNYIDSRLNYPSEMFFTLRKSSGDSIANVKAMAASKNVTYIDNHAKELDALNNMYSPYAMVSSKYMYLKYMEDNDMRQGSMYEWLKALVDARTRADDIFNNLHIIADARVLDSISPIYRPILKEINDSAIATKAKLEQFKITKSDKYTLCDAPECSDDMFTAIAEKYKGKVVMIDCWATWCGPCKMGIKAMTPAEEELAKQGAVFVFVTNETSPLADWMNMVQKMPGNHYRLNTEQWKKLKSLNGIPRYKIFNRNGKELLDQTGWSDEFKDKFVKTITDALNCK